MQSRLAAFLCAAISCSALQAHAALNVSLHRTQHVSCTAGTCTATAATAYLSVSDLQTMLSSGDVKLVAPIAAKDILISRALHWGGVNGLTLDAYRSIRAEAPVAVDGTGAVSLTTNDGGSGGMLSFGAAGSVSFLGLANALTIDGQPYTLVGSIADLASGIAATPSGNFALAHDYDARPDGVYTSMPIKDALAGRLEGLGHAISRLTIKHKSGPRSGLALAFMTDIAEGGAVENLTFRQEVVWGYAQTVLVAGLASYNHGLIRNVAMTATVTGTFRPGHGEICGAAGLVHRNLGTIDRSYADGSIACGFEGTVGGLVSELYPGASIANSHASASATSAGSFAGGLVGYSQGNVSASYATGSVSGGVAGGLIGEADGGSGSAIADTYATGSVTTVGAAGGLIGKNQNSGVVQRSYSTGAVSLDGSSGNVGGFVGYEFSGNGISGCYWDLDTSGTSWGAGNSNSDPNITGLSDAALKSGLPAGFDASIWASDPAINNGWPYLQGNPPQ